MTWNDNTNKKPSYCCDSRSYCMQYFNDIHCDRAVISNPYPHIAYIFRNYAHRLTFCSLIFFMCLSSLKFFWWAPEFLFTLARGRFRRSRSSKVTDIGANRKRLCDFLLVRNSNLGPILHCFGARTRFICSWPHPYSTLILGVFPLHQIAHVWRQRAHGS